MSKAKAIAGAFLLLAAAAFWWTAGPMQAGKPDAAAQESARRIGEWTATCSFSPYPAKALKNNTLTVEIRGDSGEPLTGASLVADIDMPGMRHPVKPSALAETAPGIYEGEVVPVMAGSWSAHVTVSEGSNRWTFELPFNAVH